MALSVQKAGQESTRPLTTGVWMWVLYILNANDIEAYLKRTCNLDDKDQDKNNEREKYPEKKMMIQIQDTEKNRATTK